MGSFFASVAVQWWLRRIWDWGGQLVGWLGGLLALYGLMPADMQHTLLAILQGKWGEISLASAGGFLVWAITQWRSYRATVKPQIVTEDGKQAELRELPRGNVNAVQEFARTAIQKRGRTIVELLAEKLGAPLVTVDTTINLPTVVTLGLAIIGFIIWLARLEGRVSSTADDVKGLTTSFGALQALVTLHKEQFHEYQLQVARDYVTQAGVSELKRDIITELGRVEQRVEAQIDRLMETRST